jgi:hypothetical protein
MGDILATEEGITILDFYAYMPGHNYIFVPTGDLWPAASVNGRLDPQTFGGKKLKPSDWLDKCSPVEQMVWDPAEPRVIWNRIMQKSGWVTKNGAAVFNLYRGPAALPGDPLQAGPWRDHLRLVYSADAEHIERWLAHRVQRPGEKCNHAVVLGGTQGIGKDTILEPVKAAVGSWNWQEVSPTQMLGRFNGWAKAVVVRISEARDLGDVDRFKFYDHSKQYIAAPPDVLRVDEKNLREHDVANVCGVIITTNHKIDGLYLPLDDRRHFVAWSERSKDDFDPDYFRRLYGWYAQGGIGHVAAYLRTLDLSGFDCKAPPPKTQAFWAIVQAGEAPESGELRDVIDELGNPACLTLEHLIEAATGLRNIALAEDLRDRRNRRSVPHKLERVDYVPVRNPDAADGLFKVAGRRQSVYARKNDCLSDQIRAARSIS